MRYELAVENPYQGFIQHHFRLGDSYLFVPPHTITVSHNREMDKGYLLRSDTISPKKSTQINKEVFIQLYFVEEHDIYEELADIMAQLQIFPFLPIENAYLNETHKIEGLAIKSFNVETIPDFPTALVVNIHAYEFDPFTYITTEGDHSYEDIIDWDLYRWYYRRQLNHTGSVYDTFSSGWSNSREERKKNEEEKKDKLTQKEMNAIMQSKINSPKFINSDESYTFWLKDEGELQEKNVELMVTNSIYSQYKKDLNAPNANKSKVQKEYEEKLKKHFTETGRAFDDAKEVTSDPYHFPGLILESINVQHGNLLTPLQFQMHTKPTFQYLGGVDRHATLEFTTTDREVVGAFVRMLETANNLSHNYREVTQGSVLKFYTPLTKLAGIEDVVVEDFSVQVSSQSSQVYYLSMSLVSFSHRSVRNSELSRLKQSGEGKDIQTGFIFPRIENSPFYKRFVKGDFNDVGAIIELDAQDKIKEEAKIKEFMKYAELYPDLYLPTYEEAKQAGFDIPNPNNAFYLEPDFYYKKSELVVMKSALRAAMGVGQSIESNFRDDSGGSITSNNNYEIEPSNTTPGDGTSKIDPGESPSQGGDHGDVEAKSSSKNPSNGKSDKEDSSKDKSEDKKDPQKSESSIKKTIDKIKAEAEKNEIPFELALSAASMFDPKLRQFYDDGINKELDMVQHSDSKGKAPVITDGSFKHKNANVDPSPSQTDFAGVMYVPMDGLSSSDKRRVLNSETANIEFGVRHLAEIYKDLLSNKKVVEELDPTDSSYKDKESNMMDYKVITEEGKKLDKDIDIALSALATYFGMQNEANMAGKGTLDNKDSLNLLKEMSLQYESLLKKNKSITNKDLEDIYKKKEDDLKEFKPPIKDVMESAEKEKEKKKEKEKEEREKAKKEADAHNKKVMEEEINSQFKDGSLHDMYKYDKRGSMARAFPTFMLLFIDEGRYVGSIKLSDHYFQYRMVEEITFTNNRKDATSSAEILINNFSGSLSDYQSIAEPRYLSAGELWNQILKPGQQALDAERSRNQQNEYFSNRIFLSTGTRVHLRLGYTSDARDLPTIMNGPITTIETDDEYMALTVLDDGHELTNKLKAKPGDMSDAGLLWARQEPTELVDEILTDKKGLFGTMFSMIEDNKSHSHGIMHFGDTNVQGKYFPSFMSMISPVGRLKYGFDMLGKRPLTEVNMNVYQTTGLDQEEHNKFWSRMGDALGIGQSDEDGIRINLFDKTPWDVLNIAASIGHDHYVAVHPFDFRSTIFSGKLHYPIVYGYKSTIDEANNGEYITAMKTFRQYRFYDSYTSIINNGITADAGDIKTVASGFYMDNGKMKNTPYIYADKSIYTEQQKLVNIDTTLNAKGIWMLDKIPVVGKLLNKPIKWKQDQGVAMKMTVSGLRDHMKNMYKGYLTVMGDPSAKPYDLFWLSDTMTKMTGPAEIEEVTHLLSFDTGFITVIKPSLLLVSRDTTVINETMRLSQVATAITFQFIVLFVARASGSASYSPIMNFLWSLGKGMGKKIGKTYKLDKAYGWGRSKVNQAMINRSLKKWSINGDLKKANQILGTNFSASELMEHIKSGKMSLKDQRKLQEALAPSMLTRGKDFAKTATVTAYEKAMARLKESKRARKFFDKPGKFMKKINLLPSIKNGVKKAKNFAKGARMTNIIGWASIAIEMLVVNTTSAFINELFERSAMQNRAIIMIPLKRGERHMLAGVDGHQGSVVGDSPGWISRMMSQGVGGKVLSFAFGIDTTLWDTPGDYDNVTAFSSEERLREKYSGKNTILSFYEANRPSPKRNRDEGNDDIQKDALEALNANVEKVEKERKRRSFREFLKDKYDQIKNSIKNWFGNMFKKIIDVAKSFMSSNDDSGDDGGPCTDDMNGPPVGKATGLSKYFDYLNPKLEAEAKKQGVLSYLEIIKAITMRESGGNYHKLPDVMQASESKGWKRNTIKSVDLSIKYGIEHFKKALSRANYDIMTVFQTYNYGLGFADWLKRNNRGGKYTKELAYKFSEEQVRKYGKISRIPPGYGDSQYAQRILREQFNGKLPNIGNCQDKTDVSGGSSECPTPKKVNSHRVSNTNGLVHVSKMRLKENGLRHTPVAGAGQPYLRRGTLEVLYEIGRAFQAKYKKSLPITSMTRIGATYWHSTGWAVDIDTPNTMRYVNGVMQFTSKKDIDEHMFLVELSIKAGIGEIVFGDKNICDAMNRKYGHLGINGKIICLYDPKAHHNHLHLSFPNCKKKK